MQPFEYQRADQPQNAIQSLAKTRNAKILAGGTNLIDLMKQGVEKPTHLIDVNRLRSPPSNHCRTAACASAR